MGAAYHPPPVRIRSVPARRARVRGYIGMSLCSYGFCACVHGSVCVCVGRHGCACVRGSICVCVHGCVCVGRHVCVCVRGSVRGMGECMCGLGCLCLFCVFGCVCSVVCVCGSVCVGGCCLPLSLSVSVSVSALFLFYLFECVTVWLHPLTCAIACRVAHPYAMLFLDVVQAPQFPVAQPAPVATSRDASVGMFALSATCNVGGKL